MNTDQVSAVDHLPTLAFRGTREAELFTREIAESFKAVLAKNYVSLETATMPAGFVSASVDGRPCTGTMWTRDCGTFGRELVQWGLIERAKQTMDCCIRLVGKNAEGFYCFPEQFEGKKKGTGEELDGTAAIIIAMVSLWQRLPASDPMRARLYDFLHGPASPVKYLHTRVDKAPLLAGTGEFGSGMGAGGAQCNVVQNSLAMLALITAARMEEAAGDKPAGEQYRAAAIQLRDNMLKYLLDERGAWLWSVNPGTFKPDANVNNAPSNIGASLINGVASMYSDVLGLTPAEDEFWRPMVQPCLKTFDELLSRPLRKEQFEKYGIYIQFEQLCGGCLTSPSYGQGYAIQTLLLYDRLEQAAKALAWLATCTYEPIPEFAPKLHRDSPYWFYERTYSPMAVGRTPLEEGCGALNLVCVSEPLKVARLIMGVDDTRGDEVRIVPRLPQGWTRAEALDWPVWTGHTLRRANLLAEKTEKGLRIRLKVSDGRDPIPNVSVRLAPGQWQSAQSVHDNTWE
ncbi:MAG: hypothetical protein ACOYOU_20470 [Kiritimatiellia bacterium]